MDISVWKKWLFGAVLTLTAVIGGCEFPHMMALVLVDNVKHSFDDVAEYVKFKKDTRNMSDYLKEKFVVQFASESVYIDQVKQRNASVDMGVIYVENNFKSSMVDARGEIVRLWVGGGGSAGGRGNPLGGEGLDYLTPLPVHIDTIYYVALEDKFYRLNVDLPTQKIYELFQKKFPTRMKWFDNYDNVPEHYNALLLYIAPQGHVTLMADGRGYREEITTFQAQEIEWDYYNEFFQTTGIPIDKTAFMRNSERWRLLGRDGSERVKDKLLSGWKPSSDWFKSLQVRYPWNLTISSSNLEIEGYTPEFITTETWDVLSENLQSDQTRLKPAPTVLYVWLKDKRGGERYRMKLILIDPDSPNYAGEYFTSYESPDTNDLMSVFQRMYPQRSQKTNGQTVDISDFSQLNIEIDDISGNVSSVALKKGSVRIPFVHFKVEELNLLEPGQYVPGKHPDTRPKPPPLTIKETFQPMVCKVNELCPQTGMWYSDYLGSADGLLMRKGHKMPGQSFVAEGVDPDLMIWTLIKPLPHLDG